MPRLDQDLPLPLIACAIAAACIGIAAREARGDQAGAKLADETESTLSFAASDAGAGGPSATPLLSYRRTDDTYDEATAPGGARDGGVNPLRSPAPSLAPPRAQITPNEITAGEPQYIVPASANESKVQADAASGDAEAADALPPAPIAPVDDYDAAPLLEYKAPVASSASAPRPMPSETGAAMGQPTILAPAPLSSISADDAPERRLAPRSAPRVRASGDEQSTHASFIPGSLGQFKGLASAGAGLAIVVSLFLLFAWTMRRGGSKPTGVLPEAAFAVLGRAPLTSQSFAQLLRVGNKLVLVAMSADGAQPLAEVTDPLEVDRIAGLCMSGKPTGSSAEFQQVLAQLSKEPARGFLGREASQPARRRA